jgi:hypothetical protein
VEFGQLLSSLISVSELDELIIHRDVGVNVVVVVNLIKLSG